MRYRVSDLADLNIRSVSKNAKGVIYYIDTSSVFQGHFREANRYSAIADAPSRARRLAQEGDTVISMVRPSNEHIGFIDFDTDNYVFSTGFVVVHPNSEIVEPFYLYLLLSLDSTTRYLQQIAETSTTAYPSVKVEDIGNLSFDIPEISKQRKIVHKIRIIEQKIKLNQEINDNLLEFLDAIFVKKFLNSYKQKDTISDFAEITRGASPRPISKYIVPTGRPWVKISDVTSLTSPFLSETKEYISEEGIQNSRTVEPGDLILSNSATPGIPIFMDLEASVHDGWLIIRNLKMISKEWLYLYFRQMRKQLVAQSNGSVFNNLKTQIVKDFPMPLITQAEVDNFQQIVAPIFGDLKVLHHENIQLKEIRDCLLSRYF
ncbi:restriction endonuclease subunit S [Lactobacillus delbrueckii subsp. bulgaricus]|nr:hypothetical protein [Lactobacillus delbrueckii subsp. bulgaricus]